MRDEMMDSIDRAKTYEEENNLYVTSLKMDWLKLAVYDGYDMIVSIDAFCKIVQATL
jgi:hypothetical protein